MTSALSRCDDAAASLFDDMKDLKLAFYVVFGGRVLAARCALYARSPPHLFDEWPRSLRAERLPH